MSEAAHLRFTSSADDLRDRDVFIVTVPTPVDEHKRPDFTPLIQASRTIGQVLKPGDVVVYESTVYPGATEEICVPVLERASGLRFNMTSPSATARSASTRAIASGAWRTSPR